MKGLSPHKFMTQLEPFLRSLVREEVERAIKSIYHLSPISSLSQFESSEARAWQLRFVNKLPSTLFTGSRIESEDNSPIKIVILDTVSGKFITSGSISSVKIELVVLNGDFGADGQEDWTEKEFNANIVREREGKRPLVTGELMITLRDGFGFIGDVSFTDNSSWIRSRKFRLGARVVQNNPIEVKIREARSEAFVVKDHRGESYKKHHPPTLDDEVWRLEKIAKGGTSHQRLSDRRITTVKDFLQLYYVDPCSLFNVLGGGISKKTWKTIIEHATACVLDDKLYIYYRDVENVGLLFNSVFQVAGATFDGQSYQSLDKLNELQMGWVENLKRQAYGNLNDLVPVDAPSVFGPAMLSSSLPHEPYSASSSHLHDVNIPGVHQDQLKMQLASNHMTMATSPPYIYDVQGGSQPEISETQLCHPMQVFSPTLQNSLMAIGSCSGPYGGGNSWAATGSVESVMQISHITAYDNSQVGTSTWQGNGLFFSPRNDGVGAASSNFGIHSARNGKARWCMLRAAVKWGISVRRDVAAKRMARLLFLNF